jgi:hypothetical protein
MSEVSIIRIDQLASGDIALNSPVMFGEGEFILKDTVSNLLDLLPTPDPNVRLRLQDLEITVLEEDLETFLNTVDVTIAEGEIVFLRFGVIRSNGFIARETYAIPLSSGEYTPLGSTIPFSDLILINQEEFGIEGDANTIVYTFVSIGEINASDPATDFSDDTKEYIVILNNFPYLFIGTNDFYGEGESTMVEGDLQQLVPTVGVQTVIGDLVDNTDPLNPIVKSTQQYFANYNITFSGVLTEGIIVNTLGFSLDATKDDINLTDQEIVLTSPNPIFTLDANNIPEVSVSLTPLTGSSSTYGRMCWQVIDDYSIVIALPAAWTSLTQMICVQITLKFT